MRCGVIDFGTNTIRLDVFECEDEKFSVIYDQAVFSQVVENTADGALTQDGVEHVIQGLEELQLAARHYRCDRVDCFATASLRYVSNADNIVEQIAFRTGINVRRISGDEEARYDYLALKAVSGPGSGVGMDLGGGSFQLFTFAETGPVKAQSFPLGSSRMARFHVAGLIPTAEELSAIKTDVTDAVDAYGFGKPGGALLAMGGTAKAAARFCKRTILKLGYGEDDGATIHLKDLDAVIKVLSGEPEDARELLEAVEPDRASTLIPGMQVLSAVAETLGCDKLKVYAVGVREGFLADMLSKK